MRSQELDNELESADRVPCGFADSHESRALLDEIGAQIVTEARSPVEVRHRGRFALPIARRGVMLGSAVGVLAVGGAAAATVVLTTTTAGTGQAGYCQTATNATADVPFPSGDQAARNWALLQSSVPKPGATLNELCAGDAVSAGNTPPSGGAVPVTVGTINEKATFVMVAFCVWTNQWLTGQQNGDTATASAAASEIAGARQWPSAQAVDASSQTLDWLPAAQQAVQAGDVSEVSSMFQDEPQGTGISNECRLETPPANSENGTVNVPLPQ